MSRNAVLPSKQRREKVALRQRDSIRKIHAKTPPPPKKNHAKANVQSLRDPWDKMKRGCHFSPAEAHE